MSVPGSGDRFRRCTSCAAEWPAREDFLGDPDVHVMGYQAHFEELEAGLFLFNHAACGTTLALPVSAFTDLHGGGVFRERKTGSPDCLGYCLRREELGPCPASCECAYVREVLQLIRRWPKHPGVRG